MATATARKPSAPKPLPPPNSDFYHLAETLSVDEIDAGTCRYTNQVFSNPTPAFLDMLEAAGISFDDAVADRQTATDDHNRRETALYAQSLERKALARN